MDNEEVELHLIATRSSYCALTITVLRSTLPRVHYMYLGLREALNASNLNTDGSICPPVVCHPRGAEVPSLQPTQHLVARA